MGREIERPLLHHQRAPSTAAANLAMRKLFIIAVLTGPALMVCIGLLRVLEGLIDAKTNLEGAPSSEFHATDKATHAVGSDSPVNRIDRID
jgi:hypothetical protein